MTGEEPKTGESAQTSADVDTAIARAAGSDKRKAHIPTVLGLVRVITEWLAAGYTPREAQARAMEPPPRGLGMGRYSASRYVGGAIHQLRADSANEPLESKRARIIAMTHAQIRAALARKRRWERNGKPVEEDAPDIRSAIAALDLLAQLEGVKR